MHAKLATSLCRRSNEIKKKCVGQMEVIQTVPHFSTFQVSITASLSTKLQPHLVQAELQKVELLLGIGIIPFLY